VNNGNQWTNPPIIANTAPYKSVNNIQKNKELSLFRLEPSAKAEVKPHLGTEVMIMCQGVKLAAYLKSSDR
jgi:hypothetical protein